MRLASLVWDTNEFANSIHYDGALCGINSMPGTGVLGADNLRWKLIVWPLFRWDLLRALLWRNPIYQKISNRALIIRYIPYKKNLSMTPFSTFGSTSMLFLNTPSFPLTSNIVQIFKSPKYLEAFHIHSFFKSQI